ncbi:unnamed protein product [Urochloa humidicola]
MAASPEFYKPAAPAAFTSPCASPILPPGAGAGAGADDDLYSSSSCRTPTGSGISYLKEPTTCPPAPRKPPAPLCKKRLFQSQQPVISLRLDELERIFRPHHNPNRPAKKQQQKLGLN